MSETLDTYTLCEECKQTLVKVVYSKYGNKPLCRECRRRYNKVGK